MTKRARRSKSRVQVPDHPVVPGSILYRALQQVACAVAERLAERGDADREDKEQPKSRRAGNAERA
jgi:hypothetical protein